MPAPSCGDIESLGWKSSWDLVAGRGVELGGAGGVGPGRLPFCRDGFVTWPFPWGSFCLVSQPCFHCSWWLGLLLAVGKCELWSSFQTLGQAFILSSPWGSVSKADSRPLGQGCSFLCFGAAGAPVAFSLAFCSLVNSGVCVLAYSLQAPRALRVGLVQGAWGC